MSPPTHPAASLPESLRFQYVAVLVSLVYADGRADERELSLVRRLCDALRLGPWAHEALEAAMRHPNAALVDETLRLLGAIGDLRFSLMADAIAFGFVDGRLSSAEATALHDFADALGVSRDQALALARWVEGAIIKPTNPDRPLTHALAAGLAGMPVDAASTEAALRWLQEVLQGGRER